MIRRLLPALLSLLALAAIVGATAGAQGTATAPAPSSCAQIQNDAPGDGTSKVFGQETGAGPANLEITRSWFETIKGKTTVNIQVKDLNEKISSGDVTSILWYAVWEFPSGTVHFVSATSDGTAVTFDYGSQVGTTFSSDGQTTGKMFPGPNGVMQIVVPTEVGGGKGGNKLEAAYTITYEGRGAATPVASFTSLGAVDSAPDDTTAGKTYTVTSCDAGTPAPGATPDPASTPAPGTGGTPNPPGSTPPPAGKPVSNNTLAVTVTKTIGSAKKAKKGKTLIAALKSKQKISNLQGTLLKGKTVVGKGTLASFTSKGKLKLKLSKALKKGSYTLYLEADHADGSRHGKRFKVSLKK
jgi:hypothetical protein